ncbi:MAG: hypothetical protein FJY11_06100 [Bacteroidetes bacterium]|nr:hypothetical protein [Bacteroidota bacterium]
MSKTIYLIMTIIAGLGFSCSRPAAEAEGDLPGLFYSDFAGTWDEAVPLGNGMLGALVWKMGDNLRISLDRADLWDLRPMPWINDTTWRVAWVSDKWETNRYAMVQQAFDRPYDELPAPSKIPAGAIEFDISGLGETEYVRLNTADALCEVKWKNGASLKVFVSAGDNTGWFEFRNTGGEMLPVLVAPSYTSPASTDRTGLPAGDLQHLGYPAGTIVSAPGSIIYSQKGWGDFSYEVAVNWQKEEGATTGCWSITSTNPGYNEGKSAAVICGEALPEGFARALNRHEGWWRDYRSASSVSLPDTILHKQWYLEMYKFGSAARSNTPPVSLQAVWTADNGKLPPWKGDFHHDLNTQLSYWPAYSSNHLEEASGFTNWLWNLRDTFRWYTNTYYETGGINVPGVTTLDGQPMGGWIQYSFGPTVSAWLAHHFYLQWRYSLDRRFLEEKAFPWLRETAVHLRDLSVMDENGFKKLPLSSSPEIFDNSARAWFPQMTNFDLALVRWTFEKAAELASELGLDEESELWTEELRLWPSFAADDTTGLLFAPGLPYLGSHRHFSHLMAFHPLGLIDYSGGEDERRIIDLTIGNLEKNGTDWWTGYSFAWLGSLYARAFRGDDAAQALRTFAECFCLPNSFHVNGDQSGTGKSKFTYRPFTLEGNFAFAAGIQEMLLQSHTGVLHIFPAIPDSWADVEFATLRAEGALLVSAVRSEGVVKRVEIESEKGGEVRLKNPFSGGRYASGKRITVDGDNLVFTLLPGENILIKSSKD